MWMENIYGAVNPLHKGTLVLLGEGIRLAGRKYLVDSTLSIIHAKEGISIYRVHWLKCYSDILRQNLGEEALFWYPSSNVCMRWGSAFSGTQRLIFLYAILKLNLLGSWTRGCFESNLVTVITIDIYFLFGRVGERDCVQVESAKLAH